MVKLVANGSGQIDYYDEPQFTWSYPGTGGAKTVTHNKGKRPDVCVVACLFSGKWVESWDVQNNSGAFGWARFDPGSSLNTEALYLYQNPAQASTPARIRLVFLTPGVLDW